MNRQKIVTSMILSCVLAGAPLSIVNAQVSRPFAGTSRYDTAMKIISSGWAKSDSAVISSGNNGNLVDALTAAPLARKLRAPIFLTNGVSLDSAALSKIRSLGVKSVYITSGTAVIKSSIETQLKSNGVKYIYRLGGASRYETSVNIAKAVGNKGSIMVARGDEYADALSAATIAASQGIPILLSDKSSLPKSISDYVTSNSISTTYVLGLQGALSDNVANKLPNPKRLGGQNRYDTNISMIKEFEDDLDYSKVYIAAGGNANLVDALAGSPLASMSSSPVILTNSVLPDSAQNYLKIELNTDSDIEIFGGLAAVPEAVSDSLENIQRNSPGQTASCTASVKTVVSPMVKTITVKNAPAENCTEYRVEGSSKTFSIGTSTTMLMTGDNAKVYFYASNGDLIAKGSLDISNDSDSIKFSTRIVK